MGPRIEHEHRNWRAFGRARKQRERHGFPALASYEPTRVHFADRDESCDLSTRAPASPSLRDRTGAAGPYEIRRAFLTQDDF